MEVSFSRELALDLEQPYTFRRALALGKSQFALYIPWFPHCRRSGRHKTTAHVLHITFLLILYILKVAGQLTAPFSLPAHQDSLCIIPTLFPNIFRVPLWGKLLKKMRLFL